MNDGDGCSSSCLIEPLYSCTHTLLQKSICSPICGDGKVKAPETCDDGLNLATPVPVHCNANCIGFDSRYICTGGDTTSASVCLPKCGDAIRVSEEECDDGNLIDTDGCYHNCTIDVSYNCT